jgi:hypothetical protein
MNIPERWKPYFFGALTGLLLTASVGLTGQFFGTSTTFPRATGWIYETLGFDPSQVAFYQVSGGTFGAKAFPDWQLLFVIGIGVGAFLSAILSGTFKTEKLPKMWTDEFGTSVPRRIYYSLAGGALAMIGARMAGGCPSGHGLSGVSQLGISSIVAMVLFFVAGIITVRVLYKGGQQ